MIFIAYRPLRGQVLTVPSHDREGLLSLVVVIRTTAKALADDLESVRQSSNHRQSSPGTTITKPLVGQRW